MESTLRLNREANSRGVCGRANRPSQATSVLAPLVQLHACGVCDREYLLISSSCSGCPRSDRATLAGPSTGEDGRCRPELAWEYCRLGFSKDHGSDHLRNTGLLEN
jgi:hypothetical protein